MTFAKKNKVNPNPTTADCCWMIAAFSHFREIRKWCCNQQQRNKNFFICFQIVIESVLFVLKNSQHIHKFNDVDGSSRRFFDSPTSFYTHVGTHIHMNAHTQKHNRTVLFLLLRMVVRCMEIWYFFLYLWWLCERRLHRYLFNHLRIYCVLSMLVCLCTIFG